MAESKKKETPQSKKTETRFPVDVILEQPEVFNTSSYILAGALHGKGDEFSKNEVNSHVRQFLKQEVK